MSLIYTAEADQPIVRDLRPLISCRAGAMNGLSEGDSINAPYALWLPRCGADNELVLRPVDPILV